MSTPDKVIESAVYDKIISTFRKFPTSIQDTLLKLISLRLQELYAQTLNYSDDILNPGKSRYDILKAKAAQFDLDIDNESSLTQQINTLNAIYSVYSKRGSIDSIVNMWKYYGGNLPKNVSVTIPAHDLFRYSMSKLSGSHRFQDGVYYTAGVYNINIDDEYDINSVRDFIVKELVAAGTDVLFNRIVSLTNVDGNLPVDLRAEDVADDYLIDIDLGVNLSRFGLMWSSHSPTSTWSGLPNLFIDITRLYYLDIIPMDTYNLDEILVNLEKLDKNFTRFLSYNTIGSITTVDLLTEVSYSSNMRDIPLSIHYYDVNGEELLPNKDYPGRFILAETSLSEVIL